MTKNISLWILAICLLNALGTGANYLMLIYNARNINESKDTTHELRDITGNLDRLIRGVNE